MNMQFRNIMRAFFAAGVLLSCFAGTSRADSAVSKTPASTPLMSILDRFTASDVPKLAAAEAEVADRKAPDQPAPTDLPGKGLAEHPMLYIGEGYNKMYLVK